MAMMLGSKENNQKKSLVETFIKDFKKRFLHGVILLGHAKLSFLLEVFNNTDFRSIKQKLVSCIYCLPSSGLETYFFL